MDAQDLLQRYARGQRDFSHADLQSADLSHQNLSGISLAQANLSGANLAVTDLHAANLRQAILKGANLTGANLTAANLRRTNFIDAVLDTACLESAATLGAILPDGTVVDTHTVSSSGRSMDPGDNNHAEGRTEDPGNLVPECAPHSGALPPASALASFSPVAAPAESVTRPRSLQDFKTHLPWASLFFLAVSYLCFGILLGMHHATPLLWAIALGDFQERIYP
jgi:Pentapeptide repeats (8 copies)